MLDRLRIPFFLIAAVVLLIAIGVEAGSSFVHGTFDAANMRAQTDKELSKSSEFDEDERNDIANQTVQEAQKAAKPPGLAISYMALLDALLLYSVLLMGLAMLFPERVLGRVQGIVTLIVSIIVLIAVVMMLIAAFIKLMIMIGLFTAAPFGTLAYLAIWGFFDRGTAATMLSISMFLKIVFLILLVLAHQRFLQNKGLVALIITSIVCAYIIAFLQGFVPLPLVSITDAIGAIVAAILIIIWGIVLLIGSVISVVKAIV